MKKLFALVLALMLACSLLPAHAATYLGFFNQLGDDGPTLDWLEDAHARAPEEVSKYYNNGSNTRIKEPGFSKTKVIEGKDMAECVCLLQKRWEDEEGNIHALRVGTMRVRFDKNTSGWVEGKEFPIKYGDISKESYYRDWMGMVTGERTYHAMNSQGKTVPIREEGWADANETPTHLIVKFDSSYGGAYVGTEGNTLWIDNVKFVY